MELALERPALCDRNRVYAPASRTRARYRLLLGGSDAGKSVFTAQDFISRASRAPCRLLVLRKTYRTCRLSTFKLLLDILRALGTLGEVKVNHTDMTLTFANGSEILHAGLDDPEKLKSITGITDIWWEEATEGTYDKEGNHDFGQVDLRLRGPAARQLTLTFNPNRHAAFFVERFGLDIGGTFPPRRGYAERGDVFVQHTSYLDNPHSNKAVAERVYAKLGPSMRRVYELGLFAETDDPDQLIASHLVKQAFETDPDTLEGDGLGRLGVDVAWTGSDDSALAYFTGYHLTRLELFHGQDPTRTGDLVKKAIAEGGYSPALVAVDDIGMGATVKSNLWHDGFQVQGFTAGASAVPWQEGMPPEMKEVGFGCLRDQAWFFLRCLLSEGRVAFSVEDPDIKRKLTADLTTPRYRYKTKGVIEVEPKVGTATWGLRSRLGRSTDPGDAVVMGAFADFADYKEPKRKARIRSF